MTQHNRNCAFLPIILPLDLKDGLRDQIGLLVQLAVSQLPEIIFQSDLIGNLVHQLLKISRDGALKCGSVDRKGNSRCGNFRQEGQLGGHTMNPWIKSLV